MALATRLCPRRPSRAFVDRGQRPPLCSSRLNLRTLGDDSSLATTSRGRPEVRSRPVVNVCEGVTAALPCKLLPTQPDVEETPCANLVLRDCNSALGVIRPAK